MKRSLFTLSTAFVLVSVSQAAILVDDFESYDKDNTTSMNSLGSWSVTNGVSAGIDRIAVTTDSTFDGSTGAALIGGWAPDSAGPTTLSTGATVGMFAASSIFALDFGFYDSMNANRDDYSIKLTSTGGANLLTINLTPAGVNTFNIGFNSAFFTGQANWGTLDALDTMGSPFFQVQFETSTDGVNMFYSLDDLNGGNMSSGTLTGTSLTDQITNLAISVDTTGGAGDGFLIIDNVSLIPEPSSILLVSLAGIGLVARRKRA